MARLSALVLVLATATGGARADERPYLDAFLAEFAAALTTTPAKNTPKNAMLAP